MTTPPPVFIPVIRPTDAEKRALLARVAAHGQLGSGDDDTGHGLTDEAAKARMERDDAAEA